MELLNRRKIITLSAAAGLAIGAAVAADVAVGVGHQSPPKPPVVPKRPSVCRPSPPPKESALVVYFSRSGQNFPNLDLEVGNTAQVAGFIHDRMGGDIFQIVPSVPYPDSPEETKRIARRELSEQIYPEYQGAAPDVGGYGTIFLGYPIWCDDMPMIVQTFIRDNDLSSSQIVPFVTYLGSHFGNSLQTLAASYPETTLIDGFERQGEDVFKDPENSRKAVGKWLERLGF